MPTPPRLDALAAWYKGDAGVNDTAGLVNSWDDQSGQGQDLDVSNTGFEPTTGADSLDGINGITFPLDDYFFNLTAKKFLGRTANLKSVSGDDFGSGVGEHPARTVMAVILPRRFGDTERPVGGTVATFRQQGPSAGSFTCLFWLQAYFNFNEPQFFVYGSDGPYGAAPVKAPNTLGAVYKDIPTLVEWRGDYRDLAVAANAEADFTLSPSLIPVGATDGIASGAGFCVGSYILNGTGFNFQGVIFELLVWDEVLTGADLAAARIYVATRFPSLGIVVPTSPPVISPRRLIVAPGDHVAFSAADGTPPYTFGFATGGNLSGGSIDSGTGEYEAGENAPAEDVIEVTDVWSLSDSAEVSVAGVLYRNYQSKTPAGRKGPRLLTMERVYGGEKDIQFERARQATRSSLLGLGPPDALDYNAEDRLLPRAANESPADDGGANDQALAERLRTMWEGEDGHDRGGGHEGLLRALFRAGFPSGDPDSVHIIQRTRLVSYLSGSTVTFIDHLGAFDPNPSAPAGAWHYFILLFPTDFTPPVGSVFEDGDPSADLLNSIVRQWKPGKARFMGSIVIESEFTWGWPLDAVWGGGGRVWGGSSRFVAP